MPPPTVTCRCRWNGWFSWHTALFPTAYSGLSKLNVGTWRDDASGLSHLWFVTLHPFDDGNGCIARAVGDLMLARASGSPQRFYSLPAQIQRERKDYHDILERTQKGSMDITACLAWFLDNLHRAIDQTHHTLDALLVKTRFWQRWSTTPLNERQATLLNRVLDGF